MVAAGGTPRAWVHCDLASQPVPTEDLESVGFPRPLGSVVTCRASDIFLRLARML